VIRIVRGVRTSYYCIDVFYTVMFLSSLKELKGWGWVCQYESRDAGSIYDYSGTPLWAANKLPAI